MTGLPGLPCRRLEHESARSHEAGGVIAGMVLADVGLVWQNCRTFNAEGSDIAAMADEAEAHFVQLWAKKELPFGSADTPRGSREQAAAGASPGTCSH